MAIRSRAGVMTGDRSGHTAVRGPDGLWEVSWLPGKDPVAGAVAMEALVLAEAIADGAEPGSPNWKHVERLAADLDVDAAVALQLVGPEEPEEVPDTADEHDYADELYRDAWQEHFADGDYL